MLFLCGWMIWLSGFSQAGESPVFSVQAKARPNRMQIADFFQVQLDLQYPQDWKLLWKNIPKELPPFFLREVQVALPQSQERQIQQRITLHAVGFATGTVLFPSLELALESASGETRTLKSPPIPIKLERVPPKPSDHGDIRDIQPPIPPFPLWPFALAVLLFILGIWRRLRRERKKQSVRTPDVPLSPQEIFLQKMNALLKSGLWERGEFKAFYNQIADILRQYLEALYRVPALQMTTSELLRGLRPLEIEWELKNWIQEILRGCDLVKFAKYIPGAEERNIHLKKMKHILEKTTPKNQETETASREVLARK